MGRGMPTQLLRRGKSPEANFALAQDGIIVVVGRFCMRSALGLAPERFLALSTRNSLTAVTGLWDR